MKNNLLIAAIAITALASCSSNDFVGDESPQTSNGTVGAINFNMSMPAVTRGTSEDASKLNYQFIVYAEKNETDKSAPAAGNLVFPNYKVAYTANTAYTTTSNTKDWEYVGLSWTDAEDDNVKMAGAEVTTNDQTIKYWDYAANSYTFTAISAKPDDISGNNVTINKLTSGATDEYDKGYEVTVTASADLSKLYFADRVRIGDVEGDKTGHDRTATNKYGGNVNFTFRNAMSQVRVGMYETVPGYHVTEVKFYQSDGTTEIENSSNAKAFGAIVPNVPATGFVGQLDVTYYSAGTVKNQPKVVVHDYASKEQANLVLGTNIQTLIAPNPDAEPPVAAKYLGETSTNPTWDIDGGDYTSVFPQPDNDQNMVLKVAYTLYNEITKETINITGKTVTVPAQYLKWKANYKYTYLFKINDGELYPITFDAVVIEAENGKAEYITTVTEPSITTFGVKESKYVTGGSEYAAGSDIYATIMDGGAVKDFTLGTDVNVYLVTTLDATNFPITEASVAESLAEIGGSKKITCANKNSDGTTSFTAVPDEVTTVPGEDGVDITSTHALKLTGAKATTSTTAYAIEYIKTAATYHNDGGSVFTLADETAFNEEVSSNGKIYTNTTCTTELTWSDYNASTESKAATYYRRTAVANVGTYAYKVIRVQ